MNPSLIPENSWVNRFSPDKTIRGTLANDTSIGSSELQRGIMMR